MLGRALLNRRVRNQEKVVSQKSASRLSTKTSRGIPSEVAKTYIKHVTQCKHLSDTRPLTFDYSATKEARNDEQ